MTQIVLKVFSPMHSMKGSVYQLSVKPRTENERGLPKQEVSTAYLRAEGLEGDYNTYRNSILFQGNRMNRAVLMYPYEMLEQLQSEGWPVAPGHLGENITSCGIPYDAFVLGQQYRIGPDAIIEVVEVCSPCRWLHVLPYVGKKNQKEFIATLINRRGWYARVIREGMLQKGDEIQPLTRLLNHNKT